VPSIEYYLIAESISVDQTTNRLSVFNVLEDIYAQEVPMQLPRLVAISAWHVSQEEIGRDFQAMVVSFRPDGARSHEFPINFTPRSRRHRLTVHVVGLPLDSFGEWRFELLLNGGHVADHMILLSRQELVPNPGAQIG
jgi:hypothetical protein